MRSAQVELIDADSLEQRQMGSWNYTVEPENLALNPDSAVSQVLGTLIRDSSKITLRRVHGVEAPEEGNRAYWFINRDQNPKVGRALVSVQVASDTREVYEAVFSRSLARFAQRASNAPVK